MHKEIAAGVGKEAGAVVRVGEEAARGRGHQKHASDNGRLDRGVGDPRGEAEEAGTVEEDGNVRVVQETEAAEAKVRAVEEQLDSVKKPVGPQDTAPHRTSRRSDHATRGGGARSARPGGRASGGRAGRGTSLQHARQR